MSEERRGCWSTLRIGARVFHDENRGATGTIIEFQGENYSLVRWDGEVAAERELNILLHTAEECGAVDGVFGEGFGPVCTENAGHDGDHVAVWRGEVISRWANRRT